MAGTTPTSTCIDTSGACASEEQLTALLAGLSAEVRDRALGYRPVTIPDQAWEAIRPFTIRVLAALAPATWTTAEKDLQAITAHTAWCWQMGVALTETEVFTGDRVASFQVHLATGRAQRRRISAATIGDYGTRLRAIGTQVNPGAGWPVRTGLPNTRNLTDPYPDTDVQALTPAVESMPPGPKRDLAETVLTAGLGFGPQPGELRTLAGTVISSDAAGLAWAEIPGPRARRVPVADPWAQRLATIAARVGSGRLLAIGDGTNALNEALRARCGWARACRPCPWGGCGPRGWCTGCAPVSMPGCCCWSMPGCPR